MTALGHSMPQHEAVGTGLVVAVPTGIVTCAYQLGSGSLVLKTGLLVGLANMAGMFLGIHYIAPHVDEEYMRFIFAAVMAASLLKPK